MSCVLQRFNNNSTVKTGSSHGLHAKRRAAHTGGLCKSFIHKYLTFTKHYKVTSVTIWHFDNIDIYFHIPCPFIFHVIFQHSLSKGEQSSINLMSKGWKGVENGRAQGDLNGRGGDTLLRRVLLRLFLLCERARFYTHFYKIFYTGKIMGYNIKSCQTKILWIPTPGTLWKRRRREKRKGRKV